MIARIWVAFVCRIGCHMVLNMLITNVLDKAFIDKELAGPLNEIRAQYGLAPTQHFHG